MKDACPAHEGAAAEPGERGEEGDLLHSIETLNNAGQRNAVQFVINLQSFRIKNSF